MRNFIYLSRTQKSIFKGVTDKKELRNFVSDSIINWNEQTKRQLSQTFVIEFYRNTAKGKQVIDERYYSGLSYESVRKIAIASLPYMRSANAFGVIERKQNNI